MNEKPPIFTYVRVSGASQVDGDGPQRQLAAIESFCRAHGLEIHGNFSDLAVSGTTELDGRDGFRAMLDRIDAHIQAGGTPPAIVVERMDRLARDLMVSELLLAECRKRHVALLSADQGTPIDMASNDADPTRKLIRQIMGALAEWEKSVLVKKLKLARDRIRSERGVCEGPKPYGVNQHEAEIRAYILALRARGLGYGTIANELVKQSIPCRNGRIWTKDLVRNVVKRREPIKVLAQGPQILDSDLINLNDFRRGFVEYPTPL